MKLLLTSAATALVLGTTAYAESHSMGLGAVEVTADDFYASNLIGMRLYSSEQELGANGDMINFAEQQWDDIGEINDLIVGETGEVKAVIVGVGGFLGIGEKDVAVTMEQVRTYDDENGDRFLVINSSQEALEAAPAFESNIGEDTVAVETSEESMVEATGLADATATTETDVTAEGAEASAVAEAEVETMETEAETDVVVAEEVEPEAEMVEGETEMAETDATGMTMVEREGYAAAVATDLSVDELTGAKVYGVNDDSIGEIADLVAAENGDLKEAIIDVGGFLGMGEKPVAVGFEDLQILRNEDGSDIRVYISATEEQLEALPKYEAVQ